GLGLIGPINRTFSRDATLLTAGLIAAVVLMIIGLSRNYWVIASALIFFGGAWMTGMVSLQIAAQMVLPAWVRCSGLSLGMMSFSAGIALGNIGWGAVANQVSLRTTYIAASIVLTAVMLLTYRFKISGIEPEEV